MFFGAVGPVGFQRFQLGGEFFFTSDLFFFVLGKGLPSKFSGANC